MDNIEEIAGSLASIEEICKYIQEHNIDKNRWRLYIFFIRR